MTHQLNFIYNDSDWICPSEYPDLSKAKEIAIDLETKEKTFQFKKNKLICFDARKLHMGHEPKKGPRITIAFKTKIILND